MSITDVDYVFEKALQTRSLLRKEILKSLFLQFDLNQDNIEYYEKELQTEPPLYNYFVKQLRRCRERHIALCDAISRYR